MAVVEPPAADHVLDVALGPVVEVERVVVRRLRLPPGVERLVEQEHAEPIVISSSSGAGGLCDVRIVFTPIAGIAVNTSSYATNLDDNLAAWNDLVSAARAGGLSGVSDPVGSVGAPLVRPSDGDVDSTEPNDAAGARLIVEASARFSLPYRPLVVVAGGRLTDVADAYLLDHDVRESVVVVAALGSASSRGAGMAEPNGELDPGTFGSSR